MENRKPYPSDVSDEEWAFVAPYLTLLRVSAAQREHSLREVFNGLRWLVHTGSTWRAVPHDLPPWAAVYQQTQRWFRAGCFEQIAQALRELLRTLEGRDAQPSAVVLDARTLRSTPESGHRAGYDTNKKTRGSKVHLAVDTLGHLLALVVTPADVQERDAVAALAEAVQENTGEHVKIAYGDAAYEGDRVQAAARPHGIRVQVVKRSEAAQGFVLLPKRWVVERSFAWMSRFRRLARDYERRDETLVGMHVLAFACLMLRRAYVCLEIGS